MTDRYITTWRCLGERVLDWEHHVSDSREDAERVAANLEKQGVKQWHTWKLGDHVPELSQDVMGVKNAERVAFLEKNA